jgi:ribonucleoside-triphosphate reductase
MGCRTRVMGNVYDPTREISYSRGNLSFTSINLPRLAIESDGDEELFFEKLHGMMVEGTFVFKDEREGAA